MTEPEHGFTLPVVTLTKRQADVLLTVAYLTDLNGYPPTVRQIGKELGLASSASVHDHLDALELKGYIRRSPDARRLIQLTGGPDQ